MAKVQYPWPRFFKLHPQHVLSLNTRLADGGGIRGYWSLLVLDKLMDCIAEQEEMYDDIYHSFLPQKWPGDVSQVSLSDVEQTRINDANNDVDKTRALPRTRRYLPCHYFDSICGSSTGA